MISDEKVVPVVNKKSIRLDIDGISGAYAVRVKNMEDPEWGEWINIDNKLFEVGDVKHHDAYKIDNSRFLVEWDIDRHNSLRRICCQVLTMYGISNTFCIEVLFNFEIVQHVFKFYTNIIDVTVEDVFYPAFNEFPTYKGQYILSLENAIEKTNVNGTVYFDTIFNEPVYKDETNTI